MNKRIIIICVLLLSSVPVHSAGFRTIFGSWIDIDGDCQNTRHEILIRDATEYVLSVDGCEVIDGSWFLPYSTMIINDPSMIDIDHVVPVQVAIDNGALLWSKEKRREFFNDEENLLATFYSENRSKGRRSPDKWMPPNLSYWCEYIDIWVKIKKKYDFSILEEEGKVIDLVTRSCEKLNKYKG